MMPKPLIVGAGWAGLAAAVTLAERNIPCTLIEAAPQAGGRAREVLWHEQRIDNGQHLFLGAYQQVYKLLSTLNLSWDEYFLRQPLHLVMKQRAKPDIIFKPHALPIPFNLLMGWLFARGFSLREKLSAIRFCYHLKKMQFNLEKDTSVQLLLQQGKQSQILIDAFWGPLCVAALSTNIAQASANVFMRVLQESFDQAAHYADLVFAKKSLSAIFPEPAVQYLKNKNCDIFLNTRLENLLIEHQQIIGCTTHQERFTTPHIILATSPFAAAKLTAPHPELSALHNDLSQLLPEAIVTVYLQYPDTVQLPHRMTGLTDSYCQWVFDRRFMGQPGLLAAVISSTAAISHMNNDHIGKTVVAELAQFFPHLPMPLEIKVIREKQAAFTCQPQVQALRPTHQTSVTGLWLAGDYTQTDYPACLEGAVKSGIQCAEQLAMHYER